MSMRELVDRLQADPGGVSWAGGSAGGTDHILVGMIAKAVGVDFREISYVAYAGGENQNFLRTFGTAFSRVSNSKPVLTSPTQPR